MKNPPSRSSLDDYDKNSYEKTVYSGLNGYFMKQSHRMIEKPFDSTVKFPKTLEVGCGLGNHIDFVNHEYDTYFLTDMNIARIQPKLCKNAKIHISKQDARKLEFEDSSIDRLIAVHVLEHLHAPEEVLGEWSRVVSPGGIISILLPTDPGLAWRFGRYTRIRNKMIAAGIEYDYWMAKEHVNPINNLLAFIRYYFDNRQETWYPARIPSMDLNLFYGVTIANTK